MNNTWLAVIIFYLIFFAVLYLLQVIAYWGIFSKMGESRWKAVIPLYNTYILYRACWEGSYYILECGLCVAQAYLSRSSNGLLGLAGLAALLAIAAINIKFYYRLSQSFGYGAAFTVGLIFLRPIFLLIMGFGESEYQKLQ